jgi:hypothetical protein
MEVELLLEGAEDSARELSALRDWLMRERIEGLTAAERKPRPPAAGEMGLDPVTLLVVLSAPAVTALAKSLQLWLQTRVKKVTLVVKSSTHDLKVTSENLNSSAIEEIIKAASKFHA